MNQDQQEGIYTSSTEASFKSAEDIRAEASPIRKEWTNPYKEIEFDDMVEEAVRRAEWREEFDRIPEYVEMKIETDKPVAIAVLSDPHIGSLDVDYKALKYIVDTIKYNDTAFDFTGGDLMDLLSWNPGQDKNILNFEEQYQTMYSMLKELKSKTLAGVMGNHRWQNKKGVDQYEEYLRNFDAPMFDNLGYIKLWVGEVPYNIVLAHKLKGLSYLNDNHPQGRFSRETEGADVIISCHTHDGASQSTSKSLFGGERKGQTFINGKTFKKNDVFLRGEGETNFDVGVNWLYLSPYKKQHFAIPNTQLAYEVMQWDIK